MASSFGDKKKNSEVHISTGLTYIAANPMERGSRLLLLLAKGLIVYLIVGGLMGAFLSTVNIEYATAFVQIGILIIALGGALIYYSKLTRNVIYIVFVTLFLYVALQYRNFINSGFYAVLNEVSMKASNYFGTSTIHKFGESMGDRYMPVTYMAVFIGSILSILINMVTTKKARIGFTILFSFFMLAVPIYMDTEPKLPFVVMFLGGIFMMGILNSSIIYEIPEKNDSYRINEKKHRLVGYFDGKQIMLLTLAVVAISFATAFVSSKVVTSNKIKYKLGDSAIKENSKDTFENMYILGIQYLFNRGVRNGGLTWGSLGNANRIINDYETDLTVTFVPYTTDRIYLAEYRAADYWSYENKWEQTEEDIKGLFVTGDDNYNSYKEAFENGNENVTRFKMNIGVVDQASMYRKYQLPYYASEEDWKEVSVSDEDFKSETEGYFYVYSDDEKIVESKENLEVYTYLPGEIIRELSDFCQRAGLNPEEIQANPHMLQEKLADYFQENYTYTLKPGITPEGKDFVAFFLENNKKGYCVHFATAATIIARYLGVPSRFVEGYAIDFSEIANEAELVEDAKISDYQTGFNRFGDKTAVVRLEVSDKSAHAWSEIYIEGEGWVPLDVTPYSEEDEEDESSLWSEFLDLMGSGGSSSGGGSEAGQNGFSQFMRNPIWRKFRSVPIIVLFVAVGGGVLFVGIRFTVKKLKYMRSNINQKLIIDYDRFVLKKIKDDDIRHDKINFREQIEWLVESQTVTWNDEQKEWIIAILERAAFSQHMILEEEFTKAKKYM